ncbi:MAG: hypothetical protein SOR57_11960 [Parabacteroides sp.]|nr:hypothetical protein [Parabacteroides sp.]
MNRKKLLIQNIGIIYLMLCVFLLASCANSEKMDEDAVREYLNTSPALTLYSTCSFDDEQPDLKEDFLGKTRYSYEYKAFNYIVDHFEDFYMNESLVQGTVYLTPANLTKAGQRYDEINKNTPHKAQKESLFECFFRFNRFEGVWKLVELQTKEYSRRFWNTEKQSTFVKNRHMDDIDALRFLENKDYEY